MEGTSVDWNITGDCGTSRRTEATTWYTVWGGNSFDDLYPWGASMWYPYNVTRKFLFCTVCCSNFYLENCYIESNVKDVVQTWYFQCESNILSFLTFKQDINYWQCSESVYVPVIKDPDPSVVSINSITYGGLPAPYLTVAIFPFSLSYS